MKIEASTYPNEEGAEQERAFTLSGDDGSWRNPRGPPGPPASPGSDGSSDVECGALDMNTTRRDLFWASWGYSHSLASIGAVRAQPFPTRPVHWIVPFPGGGSSDIRARLIGHTLTEQLRQPFVIENRVGAGGPIGTQAVATAPADGHTLLLVAAPNAINTALYEHSAFQFRSRYCAGRQHRPRSADHAGGAIVSCPHGRAIHRSCEGQPRKILHGIRRQRYAASRGG